MKLTRTIFQIVGIGPIVASILMSPTQQWPTSTAAAVSDRSNGQILQIEGDVQVERPNRGWLQPTPGTLLYPGDRLKIALGGQVFVQCADLTIESVSGDRIDTCAEAVRHFQECSAEAFRCPHRGDAIVDASIPYILSPRRTYLLDDRPKFRWNPVSDATSYTVQLWAGREVYWTATASDASMEYPTDQLPLKPGVDYTLVVETDTGKSSLDESPVPGGLGFRLLEPTQAEAVINARSTIEQQNLDPTAQALALAFLYTEHGLIADSIKQLEALVASGTQTESIQLRLSELYRDYLSLQAPSNRIENVSRSGGLNLID
jgi:hypothetical protein